MMIDNRTCSSGEHVWPMAPPSRRNIIFIRQWITLATLFVTIGVFGNGLRGNVAGGEVHYIYDEVGRLKAVVEPAGDSALYTYDAVGNLLDVTRQSSSQVAILHFTPDYGPEQTTVTISGIGFSPTPGQNTVSFNGTAATVVSSTPTEIVTTVPVGASTGTVAVTSPNGSDTSSETFTVTAASDEPMITNVSPTLALPATAITIDGTNFDPTPGNTKLYFNVTKDTAASISATEISTTIPAMATSGPVKVTTLKGTVIGQDVFIPPPSYTVNQVESTSRITPGGSAFNLSIANQNNIALMVFDGNGMAGQRVSLEASQAGLSSMTLFNPNGTTLAIQTTSAGGKGFLEPQLLAYSGTYTLMVKNTWTTPMTNGIFTLYDVPPDVLASIVPSGPSVQVTTTVPGQNAQLTFSGTANQRVSLGVMQAGLSQMVIRNPDGTQLASANTSAFGKGFLDTQTLETTGTYRILLDPMGTNVVTNATLSLYDVPPDITGTIVPGGAPVQVTTTTPGQKAILTFSGTTGQRVSLNVTQGGLSQIRLNNPDGSLLAQLSTSAFGKAFLEPQILSTTGTYTVTLDPLNDGTVSGATLTLYDVPPDIIGSIVINGAGVPISITTPGQNALLTFPGAANLVVTVNVTGNSMGNVTVQLKRANGTTLTTRISVAATFSLNPQTLPATEVYTIFVNPFQENTGTLTLTVTSTDSTPPVVSAVSATGMTGTGATITWTTDEPADSQVEYGLTTGYGATSSLDPTLVTGHSVLLSGLSASTLYHYRVHSRDASGNLTTSGDATFTTAAE